LRTSIQRSGFPYYLWGTSAIGGTSVRTDIASDLTDWSIAAFLARVNYQFNDRLLATATIRADGSSKFAAGSQWGYFPSVALGYRLSEEDFIKNTGIWDDLKIRSEEHI